MIKNIAFVLLLFISPKLLAQELEPPSFMCADSGPIASSLFPRVIVVAKPISFVDSIKIPLIIEGIDCGFTSYPIWNFAVEQQISGFCKEMLSLPIREDKVDSNLLYEPLVVLEIVAFRGIHFGYITSIEKLNKLAENQTSNLLEKENLIFGELLKIERISEKFLLSEYGISILFPDTIHFGIDTSHITDTYFQLVIQSKEKIASYYCRESQMLGKALFEEGKSYLFNFHDYKGENWIEKRN